MMMLEELDDVGVEWEQDAGGRKVARFVVSSVASDDESLLNRAHRLR